VHAINRKDHHAVFFVSNRERHIFAGIELELKLSVLIRRRICDRLLSLHQLHSQALRRACFAAPIQNLSHQAYPFSIRFSLRFQAQVDVQFVGLI